MLGPPSSNSDVATFAVPPVPTAVMIPPVVVVIPEPGDPWIIPSVGVFVVFVAFVVFAIVAAGVSVVGEVRPYQERPDRQEDLKRADER